MQEKYEVTLGIPKYLMNAFQPDTSGTRKKTRNPTVEEDCERSLYRNAAGTIYIPSMQLWAAMRKAATSFKLQGKKTFKDLVTSSIFVEPEELPITPQDYKPFTVPVVIQRARILKSRALFEGITIKFTLVVTDERLIERDVRQILEEAGKSQGIGDWRPRFGRFEILEFKKQ